MGLFYFRQSPVPPGLLQKLIVSIPVDGAFLFQEGHEGLSRLSCHGQVSIPVDGAFLFQGYQSLKVSEVAVAGFNPRRWGFFISGPPLQLSPPRFLLVSIPVDGAFLFQESVGRRAHRGRRSVSIPVDGAFLFQAGSCKFCTINYIYEFQSP